MSKLYEALQQAKQDRKVLPKPTLVEPARVEAAVALSLETEMLGLYRALDNVFPDLNHKVILFLGAKGGEGTSTVVSSLARVVAERLERKVAVLDTDTLHPTQHRLFGVSPVVGWDAVLRGTEPVDKALYKTNGNGLCVIPVSSAMAGTVQVIDMLGMEGFFGALRERFDLVFIDCAPATASPDSIALSHKADGVVLVIEAESTRWPVAETVCQQVTKAGGKVIGIVFNKRRYYIPEFIYQRL
jgi:Mrp family chromosome partitioning ATPase